MIAGVADTHTALWYLFGDSRLTAPAKQFIDNAATERHTIALAPISLAEVAYPVEKNRLPPSAYNDLRSALANPNHVLEEAPFTADVVEAMRQVARDSVPDMPDSYCCGNSCLSSRAGHQS
jgi:PIN domain nuclease of toxin-antitoxin system